MQFYQKSRSSRLLSPLLCVVLGVLLLLWPGVSLLTVCYLLGGLLIVFGLWQTVRSAVYGLAYWGALMLSIGVLSLFLGVGLVLFPRVASSLLPIMLGIGLLIDGVTRLSFALRFWQLYG
ncbi:MAG: DUF308 domain-containing protein, partial [Eubacteriales bacterium]|nr:DUF308 domain-containing protein [Eubacteriales bacterium]